MRSTKTKGQKKEALIKVPSGIRGFDEITEGGLPRGRTTLVSGGAGCGKTIFGTEFLYCGAVRFDEPGVYVSFEETPDELIQNVASMGRDLPALIKSKKLIVEHIHIDRSEIEETGEYDLDGLFVRLAYAIDSIGAKRIVLDTLETLFSGLSNTLIVRAELRRLFHWLKQKDVTAILTGERGDTEISKYNLEEFVADCVIVLDHRVSEEVTTRRLRIVKYRGSIHGTNEYPFLIDSGGISVLPVTSLGLQHSAPTTRVSTGVERLDTMFDGHGYFRGSSILFSGTAGTGKTTFASFFANAACARGERCLYFAFEESPDQIIRNMSSVGLNLKQWIDQGLLLIHAARPTVFGLEQHLVTMNSTVEDFDPDVVVIDPMSNLVSVGSTYEVKLMLTRLVDALKSREVTALFTSLVVGEGLPQGLAESGISSLMDTWIILNTDDENGERNRILQIAKARGMQHSNQIREFQFSKTGIEIIDVYLGSQGVLFGTARRSQERREEIELLQHRQAIQHQHQRLERQRQAIEAQIDLLRLRLAEEENAAAVVMDEEDVREKSRSEGREEMARLRHADLTKPKFDAQVGRTKSGGSKRGTRRVPHESNSKKKS